MEDNYVIERIISILNNEKQSLLVGNISNPKPGVCNVNTDYGIKSAININATYPGEVLVVWDREKEQYYCFTTKPSNVINNRQISYRKYRTMKKKEQTERYVILGVSPGLLYTQGTENHISYFERLDRVEQSNIFYEKIFRKLDPKIKNLYVTTGVPKLNSPYLWFFDWVIGDHVRSVLSTSPYRTPFLQNTPYDSHLRYLQEQGINIIQVDDTELHKVKGTLWVQGLDVPELEQENSTFTSEQERAIRKIAKSYGVLFECGRGSVNHFLYGLSTTPMLQLCLDTFYNPYTEPSLDIVVGEQIRTYGYSNLPDYLDIQLNAAASPLFNMNAIPNENILSYSLEADAVTGEITTNIKYASSFYWEI